MSTFFQRKGAYGRVLSTATGQERTVTDNQTNRVKSMSIPRKGSRRIIVESKAYRWSVRRRPTYDQALAATDLTFAVELEVGGRSTLHVTAGAPRPDNWISAEAVTVSPSVVERAIGLALKQGWRPSEPGSAFELSIRPAQALP